MSQFFTLDECFRILNLDPSKNYTIEEMKKAYHKMALKYHPDRNSDPNSNLLFQKILEAYEMITNPSFAFRKQNKSRELDVIVIFKTEFEIGFFGKIFHFNLNSNTPYHKQNDFDFEIEHFEFELPSGSSGLVEHLFRNKGFKRGSEKGDLLIRVEVLPHKFFKLEGKNIFTQVSCPLAKLIRGGILEVKTMYGVQELKIPPGTKPLSQLKMPRMGVDNSNFQIVTIEPIFPSIEELKEDNDWQSFGINWNL